MVYRRRDKSHGESYTFSNGPDLVGKDYWKLSASDTESERAERGFVDYDRCTLDELLRFCQQRGLVLPRGRYATLTGFKRKFQRAVEVATFNGFLDLPPELRLRIYEFYKATLQFGDFSIASPITVVSKLVRREALSVFFKERLFLIHRERTWEPLGDMSLQVVTQLFFDRAPESFIHSLRRLEIMAPLGHGSGYAEFKIDLAAKEREKRAFFESIGTFTKPAPWNPPSLDLGRAITSVVGHLQDLADSIVARKPIAFERADADAILQIFVSTTEADGAGMVS